MLQVRQRGSRFFGGVRLAAALLLAATATIACAADLDAPGGKPAPPMGPAASSAPVPGPDAETSATEGGDETLAGVDLEPEVAPVLTALTRGLRRGDQPGSLPLARDAATDVFAVIAALPVRSFTVDTTGAASARATRSAPANGSVDDRATSLQVRRISADEVEVTVRATWRLDGDAAATAFTWTLPMRAEGPLGWSITGPGRTSPAQLWDTPAPRVLATPTALVVADAAVADLATAQDLATDVAAAVDVIEARWHPGVVPRVVIALPGSRATFLAMTGRAAGGAGRVAAATTIGAVDENGRPLADRIVLDPAHLQRTSAAGRRVLVSHEVAHVALRAMAPGQGPAWMVEGLAEHLGYATTTLSAPQITRALADGAPDPQPGRGLPTWSELDGADATGVEQAYARSWAAVDVLVEEAGWDGALRVLRAATRRGCTAAAAARADAEWPQAYRWVTGGDPQALVTAWRQRVEVLAGG